MLKKLIYPLAAGVVLCTLVYSYSVQKNLSDELLRLHIVANSNSELDQEIKIKVRDEIIKGSREKFQNAESKEEFKKKLLRESGKIEKIADDVLKESNVGYDAAVSFEKVYIPRKSYDGLILPEGNYDAMVIRLGEAKGQNWWCVVYPPLCFTEDVCGSLSEEAEEYLKKTLSPESYELIKEEGISFEYKFKVVELLQKVKKYF